MLLKKNDAISKAQLDLSAMQLMSFEFKTVKFKIYKIILLTLIVRYETKKTYELIKKDAPRLIKEPSTNILD